MNKTKIPWWFMSKIWSIEYHKFPKSFIKLMNEHSEDLIFINFIILLIWFFWELLQIKNEIIAWKTLQTDLSPLASLLFNLIIPCCKLNGKSWLFVASLINLWEEFFLFLQVKDLFYNFLLQYQAYYNNLFDF